ncbi:HlyD family secretion protein [Sulfurimonas sp.]|jgi:TfoX/Sxy family transcriptional regulator of competence genes|uniref:HlyD family secretion protein n=1 Tax=Sulfurimonas sp. TaxID=2022749 RepID=UPI0025D05F8E|nr:HlyD family secretion protein [Sulfurimonas sp.]MCK9472815.1 HlyD family secretion protein [Sulfurimonas sp.]MDD3505431.1 HlyD family secretion protein [Sulfurimonas sp.]
MRIFIVIALLFSLCYAKVYYAKVEPYEVRDISSNISGLVVSADETMIGKVLSSKAYIEIDCEVDEKELKLTREKLMYIKNSLEINEAVLVNLEDSLAKKRDNYRKIEPLKFKSSVEKDREFYDLITSENLYLNTKKEIQNLKVQISDLRLKEVQLERSIKDKKLVAEGFVLYELLVKPGQVVGMAAPLAKVADVSKALLSIYLDESDALDAKKMIIYIEGEKTPYKVSRLLNIADSKNISKYMAQIVIDSPKLFSKLVKVELRNE